LWKQEVADNAVPGRRFHGPREGEEEDWRAVVRRADSWGRRGGAAGTVVARKWALGWVGGVKG